ncbi:rubrerythrin [candidate division MSBL1 archaeon SCGC-AAA382C18]|uniref:Rubrerythrin n=1 Tax=candidate division MSBL1 archaeon SCGC-AAA382C18 TaxID=1698281 RepID=A0A133VIG0_9EURY|nr:rubrerythrin [candidate division MSBL1 archaeon SCGC-AAA382C18]
MTSTEDNLEEAFSGESQARNKYIFFAEKAEKEGKPGVAKLFRAAAKAEEYHAKNHLRTMNKIKSTKENLKLAIEGENYEHTEMYPDFIEKAEEEGKKQASKMFDYAMQVEEKHENFYQKALEAVEKGEGLEERDWYICPVCGNTFEGDTPDTCPICGVPKDNFEKVE